MSPLQTGKNFTVAYKPETTFNTPPTATGATRFRPNAGGGLGLARATHQRERDPARPPDVDGRAWGRSQ
jgi:hypothetical protein